MCVCCRFTLLSVRLIAVFIVPSVTVESSLLSQRTVLLTWISLFLSWRDCRSAQCVVRDKLGHWGYCRYIAFFLPVYPLNFCPAYSNLPFSTPTFRSLIFQSCILHLCIFDGPAFSVDPPRLWPHLRKHFLFVFLCFCSTWDLIVFIHNIAQLSNLFEVNSEHKYSSMDSSVQ